MTTCATEKNILRKLKLLKQYSIKKKIVSEKIIWNNYVKQLTVLNTKNKTEYPIYNEYFANLFKINKIYNEILLNSDNNLRDRYIDKLKKTTCISEAIPTITSTYVERLIRLTHFKTNIYIDSMTPILLKLNIHFISFTLISLTTVLLLTTSHFLWNTPL